MRDVPLWRTTRSSVTVINPAMLLLIWIIPFATVVVAFPMVPAPRPMRPAGDPASFMAPPTKGEYILLRSLTTALWAQIPSSSSVKATPKKKSANNADFLTRIQQQTRQRLGKAPVAASDASRSSTESEGAVATKPRKKRSKPSSSAATTKVKDEEITTTDATAAAAAATVDTTNTNKARGGSWFSSFLMTENNNPRALDDVISIDKNLLLQSSSDKEDLEGDAAATLLMPKALATQGDWSAYWDQDGTKYVYYFNAVSGESQWQPPTLDFPKIQPLPGMKIVTPELEPSSQQQQQKQQNQSQVKPEQQQQPAKSTKQATKNSIAPQQVAQAKVNGKIAEAFKEQAEEEEEDNNNENGTPRPLATFEAWTAYFDANTNMVYYYNSKSGVSQWDKPSERFPQLQLTTRMRNRILAAQQQKQANEKEEAIANAAAETKSESEFDWVSALWKGVGNFFRSLQPIITKSIDNIAPESGRREYHPFQFLEQIVQLFFNHHHKQQSQNQNSAIPSLVQEQKEPVKNDGLFMNMFFAAAEQPTLDSSASSSSSSSKGAASARMTTQEEPTFFVPVPHWMDVSWLFGEPSRKEL